jgi:multiple sugar transport system permease protein
VLWATLFYTVFGTVGALVMGLFAAQLLNRSFRGQGILRGLFLFPYVAPVIAVAFTWVILFDPFSGSRECAADPDGRDIRDAINFFGERPLCADHGDGVRDLALFPAVLPVHPGADAVDRSGHVRGRRHGRRLARSRSSGTSRLPQLLGILSVLFLLRFIWTFNKFDDIFLLTGGNAGTRTLTVNVYEQAFALSNIGAGAAVAVVIFGCRAVVQLRLLPLRQPGGRAVSGPAPRRGHAASNRRGNAGQRVVWAPLARRR